MTDNAGTTNGMREVEARIGIPVEAYLRVAYIEEGLSQPAIAAALGVRASTVSRWMRRYGIRARYIGPRRAA